MKKIKWTFEACKAEALKYTHRRSFKINSGSAYTRARENKWLDEICIHMTPKQKPNGYWTLEKCRIEALKYSTFSEFRLGNKSAYNSALKNKWLYDICSHIKKSRKPSGYFTLEVCIEIAKDCTSIYDMQKRYGTASRKVYTNGWASIIKEHLIKNATKT